MFTHVKIPLLLCLLAASMTLNVSFVYSRHTPRAPQALAVGSVAPTLHTRTPEGKNVPITFGKRPTVLYVLAPGCGWCAHATPPTSTRSGSKHTAGTTLSRSA